MEAIELWVKRLKCMINLIADESELLLDNVVYVYILANTLPFIRMAINDYPISISGELQEVSLKDALDVSDIDYNWLESLDSIKVVEEALPGVCNSGVIP